MKNLKSIIIAGFITLLLFTFINPAAANSTISPILSALPENLGASEVNPAFLGLTPYKFQFQLDYFGVDMGTNSWTVKQILDNINSFIDDTTKKKLLKSISGAALTLDANIHSGLYIGVGQFAFGCRVKGSTVAGIDKDILTFLLEGAEIGDLDINLKDTYAKGTVVLDNSLSYGMPLQSLADKIGFASLRVGAGLHYLNGSAWSELVPDGDIILSYDDTDCSLNGNGKAKFLSAAKETGGGGHGFATDLGVWGQYNPKLAFGLSLSNLGVMSWHGVRVSTYEGNFKVNHPVKSPDKDTFEFDGEEIIDQPHANVARATPITLQANVDYAFKPQIHFIGATGISQTPRTNFFLSVGSRFLYPKFLPVTVSIDYASHRNSLAFSTSLGVRIKGCDLFNITFSDIKLLAGQGKTFAISLNSTLRF